MPHNAQQALPLEAVNRRPLAELVAERLLDLIKTGQISVGIKLPSESELGRQLGVGRTSVREGLQRLQTLGFVQVQPGRGAYVCEPNESQSAFLRYSADHRFAVADVLEVRISLEVLGAGLAALRATAADLRELEGHLSAHRDAHLEGDADRLIATDQAFHLGLMRTARNQVLLARYDDLVPKLREFRARTLVLPDAPHRSADGHMAILDGVRAHDPQAASSALFAHLLVLYREVAAAAASTNGDKAPNPSVDLEAIFGAAFAQPGGSRKRQNRHPTMLPS